MILVPWTTAVCFRRLSIQLPTFRSLSQSSLNYKSHVVADRGVKGVDETDVDFLCPLERVKIQSICMPDEQIPSKE